MIGGNPRDLELGAVRPIPVSTAKPQVVVPGSFEDAQELADRFKSSQPVIVNLQGTDRDLSRRQAAAQFLDARGQVGQVRTCPAPGQQPGAGRLEHHPRLVDVGDRGALHLQQQAHVPGGHRQAGLGHPGAAAGGPIA